VAEVRWIELSGANNVRDVGGLPTVDGGEIAPGVLIRSANLQDLTAADVRHLVDELDVRAVADLRTKTEVDAEGPGPITREPLVSVHHLSLFPESGRNTDAGAEDVETDEQQSGRPVVLPWQERVESMTDDLRSRGTSGIYLRYLEDRPDSVIDALRLVATTDGATIVHCAAGKDRTGVVVAFALAEVGVTRDAIVADYARSGERIEAIVAQLLASPTYEADIERAGMDRHKPRPESMERFLDGMDELHGGIPAWLRRNGWTDEDAAALREQLLG
jgi:protein-tyrosine phosphatase